MLLSQPVSNWAHRGKGIVALSAALWGYLQYALLGLWFRGRRWAHPSLCYLALYLCILFSWGAFWFALAVWVFYGGASMKNCAYLVVLVGVCGRTSGIGGSRGYALSTANALTLHEAREGPGG